VRNAVQTHTAPVHQLLRCSKENISIFHSIEEAERWIGVSAR
jgi:hypothetical protein